MMRPKQSDWGSQTRRPPQFSTIAQRPIKALECSPAPTTSILSCLTEAGGSTTPGLHALTRRLMWRFRRDDLMSRGGDRRPGGRQSICGERNGGGRGETASRGPADSALGARRRAPDFRVLTSTLTRRTARRRLSTRSRTPPPPASSRCPPSPCRGSRSSRPSRGARWSGSR